MNICVLGHGNSGLMSALILQKSRPGATVYCVGSPEIGIVGVGESSTEHFDWFRKLLNLEVDDIVKNCYATYKYGVYFEGWREEDYIHSLLDVSSSHTGVPIGRYGWYADGEKPLKIIPEYMIEPDIKIDPESYPNQFHFDTFKLNQFLRSQCEKHKVVLIDDTIDDVTYTETGDIEMIVNSKTGVGYSADLFVDASGFRRFLVNKIDEFKFKSRQDDLFVDSAFAFPCEFEGDNYRQFTTAKKMNNGWMWRIPTYTRMGNGYAFNSNFMSVDDGVAEVTELLGFEPKIAKTFKFDAGHYEKTWCKNVIAIGLTSHFFEPIEATAIGISIMQAKLLAEYVDSANPITTQSYNDKIQNMFSQAFKFIRLHYVNNNKDTPFWKHVDEQKVPDEVQNLIDIAQHRIITSGDIGASSDWVLFGPENFNNVLYGQGLLNSKIAKKYMQSLREDETWKVRELHYRKKQMKKSKNWKTHREYIESIIK